MCQNRGSKWSKFWYLKPSSKVLKKDQNCLLNSFMDTLGIKTDILSEKYQRFFDTIVTLPVLLRVQRVVIHRGSASWSVWKVKITKLIVIFTYGHSWSQFILSRKICIKFSESNPKLNHESVPNDSVQVWKSFLWAFRICS